MHFDLPATDINTPIIAMMSVHIFVFLVTASIAIAPIDRKIRKIESEILEDFRVRMVSANMGVRLT